MRILNVLVVFVLVVTGCGGGSADDFCDRAATAVETIDESTATDQIEQLADDAPDEIAADIALIGRFLRQVEAFMEGEEVSDPIDEEAVDAASARVEAYLAANCGIDTSADEDESSLDDASDTGAGDVGDPDDTTDGPGSGAGYQLAVSGDVELDHSGDILCTVYEETFEMTFYPESFEWDYGLEATGYGGDEGTHAGVFSIGDGEIESEGQAEITISLGEPDEFGLLVASGSISGSYAGAAGSGDFQGTYACEITVDEAAGGAGAVTSGETDAYITYVISGDAEAERTEVDAVLCGTVEGGFSLSAPSLEAWTIDVTAEQASEGSSFGAEFSVSPPSSSDLAEPGPFASRLEGPGTVTFQETGRDATGIVLYSGTLEAVGLVSEGGFTIDFSAEFTCLGY